MIKKILLLLLLVVFSCSTVACTTSTTKNNNNPRVVLNISNGKKIEIELYPDIAPTTVENFLTLVDDGFYTNAFFHRVIDNFMIQTGGFSLEDYENGQKMLVQKSGKKTIEGEFSNNGFENNLKHTPGVISMARSDDPNSASTQFFICVRFVIYTSKTLMSIAESTVYFIIPIGVSQDELIITVFGQLD